MNLYKNHTVYEFMLYNLYNSCMDSFVLICTKTTSCTNSYNLYTICIQFVYNLYSMKNCIQVGISTGDQYCACNRRCVCHPPPHLLQQWPFYSYIGQESDTYELRKPSKKQDCTNSFVCHIVNPFGRKVLGGSTSAKTKHVFIYQNFTFLQCRWGCLFMYAITI